MSKPYSKDNVQDSEALILIETNQFLTGLKDKFGDYVEVGVMLCVGGQVFTLSSKDAVRDKGPKGNNKKCLGGCIDEIKDIPETQYGGSQKYRLDPSRTSTYQGTTIGSFLSLMLKVCDDPLLKQSTREGYMTTFKKLIEFAPMTDFADLDYAFVQKFRMWLEQKDYAINTIARHMKTIKRVIGHAIRLGYISAVQNPFADYKIRHERKPKRILAMNEIKKLHKLFLEDKLTTLEHEVLGAFLFGCYTGLRYSDLCQVSALDIRRMNTRKILSVKMQKTSKYIHLPISEIFEGAALAILSQMGNRRGQLFKLSSNSVSNRVLARILCRAFGKKRSKGISFHTARRTMATQLLSLRIPITTVQTLLGHASVKTTEVYAKVSDQTVLSDLRHCQRTHTHKRKRRSCRTHNTQDV